MLRKSRSWPTWCWFLQLFSLPLLFLPLQNRQLYHPITHTQRLLSLPASQHWNESQLDTEKAVRKKKPHVFFGAVKALSNPLPTLSVLTRFALSIYGETCTWAIHIFVSKLQFNFWQFLSERSQPRAPGRLLELHNPMTQTLISEFMALTRALHTFRYLQQQQTGCWKYLGQPRFGPRVPASQLKLRW